MAEKMSTLVLKADLDCNKCYNKMRKTLCQLHYEIRSQTWDKKQNTVTISGPFDPEVMSKKLESMAGKVIKNINRPKADKKEEEKPKAKAPSDAKPDKPAGEKPPADKKPDGDKKEKAAEKPAEKAAEKPAEKAAEKPAEKAAEAPKAAPEMKMVEPMTVIAYPVAQAPYGMYYEGYDQGAPYYHHNGYNANHHHGYNARPVYNYGGNNRGYVHGADYFSEENPTCSIM